MEMEKTDRKNERLSNNYKFMITFIALLALVLMFFYGVAHAQTVILNPSNNGCYVINLNGKTYTIITNLQINNSADVEITGIRNSGEFARVDYIEFISVGGGQTINQPPSKLDLSI